jgi:phosphohistidine swiveling domain-containing protein
MWYHVTTRIMGLYEIAMANYAYPNFPIKGGMPLNTVVIGKDGILERYVDQDQLEALGRAIQESNLVPLLREFEEYEKFIMPIFEKNPIDVLDEFIPITKELWIHEITAFFIGLHATDKETLDIVSGLRGTQNAQHVSISKFVPKLFRQISERTGISVELLQYVMPEELASLKYDPAVLAARKKLYVLELIDGATRLLINDEATAYVGEFMKGVDKTIDRNITEMKGSSAFVGKAAGKVVIVVNDKDLANVREGDILVSPMTRTSFLPAMKRAAAFVTDEGGVTCHAAIVARELKKPCVVGTKVASKVLQTGDEVDVDANKGLVSIVKRGEGDNKAE